MKLILDEQVCLFEAIDAIDAPLFRADDMIATVEVIAALAKHNLDLNVLMSSAFQVNQLVVLYAVSELGVEVLAESFVSKHIPHQSRESVVKGQAQEIREEMKHAGLSGLE